MALQAYGQGYQAMNFNEDFKGSIPLFQRATEEDPNFSMAYARLATNYSNWGETALATENARKAYELRQRGSQREKFYVEAKYEQIVNEDFEAASRIYEEWQEVYPRDDIPPNNLGVFLDLLGKLDKALAETQKSLQLDPGSGIGYANLVNSYIGLNRWDEAKATIQEAQARSVEVPNFHFALYQIAFLERDSAAMEREADNLMSRRGFESLTLYIESETAAYNGQLARARELAGRSIEASQRGGRKEWVSDYPAQSALREALIGNLLVAKREAEDALRSGGNKDVEAASAIVFAMSGDPSRALRTADSLNSRFPKSTTMQYFYLPMLRSAIALQRGDSTRAVELSAVAAPYELGQPYTLNFVALYPIYFRGQACLASHQAVLASAEFQKILNHPGLVKNELIGSASPPGPWPRPSNGGKYGSSQNRVPGLLRPLERRRRADLKASKSRVRAPELAFVAHAPEIFVNHHSYRQQHSWEPKYH